MDEESPISNRTRILFALVGIFTCLGAALCVEALLGRMKAGEQLRRFHVASLLYVTAPLISYHSVERPRPPEDVAELQRRLDAAGAASGDVQISLAWNNYNDLDLYCLEPTGEMIGGYNQASRAGGMLDVDMNSTPGNLLSQEALAADQIRRRGFIFDRPPSSLTNEPVENIVWTGTAPSGHYKVFVNQYYNREQSASTPFWLVVRARGKVYRVSGTMGMEDFANDLAEPKLAYEFDVPTAMANPTPAPVPPSAKVISPPAPPIVVLHTAYSLGRLDFALLTAGLWGALVGLLPIALVIAQRLYLRRRAIYGSDDLVVVFGGPATGFCAAIAGQLVLAVLAAAFAPRALPALFVLGWILFGAIFGLVLSLYTPNVGRAAAPIAGAVSALAGSALFLPLAAAHQDFGGHLLIATLIGGAIGALIALPEREREPDPEPIPEEPRPRYEVQPPFVVRGARTRKVGGIRQAGPPK